MLLLEDGVRNKSFRQRLSVHHSGCEHRGVAEVERQLEGTALPRLNMDQMERMIERETLRTLGLE